MLGALGSMLGQFGPILGPGSAYVGLCWLYVGPMLAYVSPILAHVGPMLALRWPMLAYLGAYVESMLAICETISVERPPRCQFFLPGPLRGTKNHVKTKVFDFRQQKKGSAEATKHRKKNDVSVTSHTRNTVNYRDFR